MKKLLLFLSVFIVSLCACEDDDDVKYLPKVSIESLSEKFEVVQNGKIELKANIESMLVPTISWSVDGKEISNDTICTFSSDKLGDHTISVEVTNNDGTANASQIINVYGKYKYGTFILNEGTTSNARGTLSFISPEGSIYDTVYYHENKGYLGSVCQDLYIKNNKLYIISQNGGNDGGYLTIANAETLKKEKSFQDNLELSMPTRLAVLSDTEIYIRDNSGISVFNPVSEELKFIEGSERARKNTMIVASEKVFSSKGTNIIVIEKGAKAVSKTIELEGNVYGLTSSGDGNIYATYTKDNGAIIAKINTKDYSIIKENTIEDSQVTNIIQGAFSSTSVISAKGDTIYISGTPWSVNDMNIFQHIFSDNKTTLAVNIPSLVENCGVLYNTAAVHPITGEVIVNSLKGWGSDYKTNQITFFDFSGDKAKITRKYNDHTDMPGGIFFTYNFK